MGQSGCGIGAAKKSGWDKSQRLVMTTAGISSRSSSWTTFQTHFGWTAIQRSNRGVLRVLMGYRTQRDLLAQLPAGCEMENSSEDALAERLREYFAGSFDTFEDVPIAAEWSTPFQRAVIRAVRQVGYGEITTYAELARRAGRPGAARAVGQVMAHNPVPLLVPCHRVLGSGGSLGGFSAPTGVVLKQALLDLEKRPRDSNPWAS